MSPDPRKATPLQQSISAGVLLAEIAIPVICWFILDHHPWWKFIAATFLYSVVGWFVGAVALTILFRVRPIRDDVEGEP